MDFSNTWLRRALPLVAVLVIGLAGGYVVSRAISPGQADGEPDVETAAGTEAATEAAPPQPQPVNTPTGTPVDPAVEEGALAVVEEFLSAEVERDFESSFALLTEEDQTELGPAAEWESSHADLPPVVGFDLLSVRDIEGRVEVVSDVELDSTLDPFVGLVPARGRATWAVAEGGDEWRVAYTQSVLEPRYPEDDDVAEVALAWAQAHQRCETPTMQHSSVLGLPVLAQDLCGSQERVGVGEIGDLEEGPDAEPFVAAWGPSVYNWSRVVPVTGPVPLRAVLAPIDDQWQVVGVLRS